RRRGGRGGRFPSFVGRGQDAAAQLFNQIGLYRWGVSSRPVLAPPPPTGITTGEWETIWHLTGSAKARGALLQDIASWQQSAIQVRAAGTLGRRPLIVLDSGARGGDGAAWDQLQTDLAGLSERGKRLTREGSRDLVYQAPGVVADAIGEVLASLR